MGSVNKVILVGNLGADPELRYTPTSQPVCSLRVATTERFQSKTKGQQEKTEWHRVSVWGKQGEACAQHLSKGRQVYVEGRLETRSYEKDGQKHYSTEINATSVVFLGGGESPANGQSRGKRERTQPQSHSNEVAPPLDDDDQPLF